MRNTKHALPLLVATFTMVVMLAGCSGGQESKDIDLDAVTKEMVAAASFDGELTRVSEKAVEKRYDLSQVESYVVYLEPTGGLADEVSLFKAKEGAAEEVKTMLEKHVEDQHAKFADYVPSEVFKIDNAIYVEKGEYVGVIIAKDGDDAQTAFDKAFE